MTGVKTESEKKVPFASVMGMTEGYVISCVGEQPVTILIYVNRVMGVYPSVASVLEEGNPSDGERLAIASAVHTLVARSIALKIAVPDFKLDNIGWDGTSARLLDLESLIFLDNCFDDTGIICVAGTFIHPRAAPAIRRRDVLANVVADGGAGVYVRHVHVD